MIYSFAKSLITAHPEPEPEKRSAEEKFQDQVMIIEHMLAKAEKCIDNIQRTRRKAPMSEDDEKYIWKKFTKMRVYVEDGKGRIDRLRQMIKDNRQDNRGDAPLPSHTNDEDLRDMLRHEKRLDAAIRTSCDVARHFFAAERIHMQKTRDQLRAAFPHKSTSELEEMMKQNVLLGSNADDIEAEFQHLVQQRGIHPMVRRELLRVQENYRAARKLEHSMSDLRMIFVSMMTVAQHNTEVLDTITLNIEETADHLEKSKTEVKKQGKKRYTARQWMSCCSLFALVMMIIVIIEIY